MKTPKLVVMVVYKNSEDIWRGFCSPYDVTCEASSKEEAKKKIEELVNFYEEGLKEYNYPEHLAIKSLSNKEDEKFFTKIVLPDIAKRIERELTKKYLNYQREEKKGFFKLEDHEQVDPLVAYYYPTLTPLVR